MILGLVFLMMAMFLLVNKSVKDMTYVITDVKAPVRSMELTSNKILLLWQIMSYTVQTPLFPDNLCQSNGISNLSSYIYSQIITNI
jgi:hypothetical protein